MKSVSEEQIKKDLLEIMSKDNMTFPYGKYNGQKIMDCNDQKYLEWLYPKLKPIQDWHFRMCVEARIEILKQK